MLSIDSPLYATPRSSSKEDLSDSRKKELNSCIEELVQKNILMIKELEVGATQTLTLDYRYYQRYFIYPDYEGLQKGSAALKLLIVAIDRKVQLLLQKAESLISRGIQQTRCYHVPKALLPHIAKCSSAISEQEARYLKKYLASVLPECKANKEMLDLKEFVEKFNREKGNLEALRQTAFATIIMLQKQAWESTNGICFPRPEFVEVTREGLLILFGCEDTIVRFAALDLMIDLLEMDPLNQLTAGGLITLQQRLVEAMDPTVAQGYSSRIQRKLMKAYALTLELILLQVSLGNLNALLKETKEKIWEVANGIKELNVQDDEMAFWANFATEAAMRLVSVQDNMNEWFTRFSILASALVTVASACHYPDYVSTAIAAGPALVTAFLQVKELFADIKFQSRWFEKVVALKRLTRFAMHDPEEFSSIVLFIQEQKTYCIERVVSQTYELLDNVYGYSSVLLYSIVCMLETVAILTTNSAVREQAIKLLIQYITVLKSSVQKRVVLALIEMLTHDEKLSNTAYIILRLLSSDGALKSEPIRQMIKNHPLVLSFPKGILQKQLIDENIEEPIYNHVIRFLIVRLADVRQIEQTSSHDRAGATFVTLLSSSYNDQIASSLLETLIDIFPYREIVCRDQTPFHLAVLQNRKQMIIHLAEHVDLFSVDQKDVKGMTPLHLAVTKKNEGCLVALLTAGANPNLLNDQGLSPLHMAIIDGDLSLVCQMLGSGGDPEVTTLEGVSSVELAIQTNLVPIFRFLLQYKKPSSRASCSSYLMNAADCGAEEIMKDILLQYQRDQVILDKREVLSIALLISHDGCTRKCSKEFLNFHLALKEKNQNYKSAFEGLLKSNGGTSLLFVDPAKLDRIRTSIDFKNLPQPLEMFGNSELIRKATSKNNFKTYRKHLLNHKEEINQVNFFGLTPLHTACLHGQLSVVKFFVENSADLNAQDQFGFTPLHYAAMKRDLTLLTYLLEQKGIDPKKKNLFGETPMLVACGIIDRNYPKAARSVSNDVLQFPTKTDDDLKILTLFGDINDLDAMENNALHHAVFARSENIISYLCHLNPTLFWKRNIHGYTPLEIAQRMPETQLVKLLLEGKFLADMAKSGKEVEDVLSAREQSKLKGKVSQHSTFLKTEGVIRQSPEDVLIKMHEEIYQFYRGKITLGNLLAEKSMVETLELLFRKKQTLSEFVSKGERSETPLHVAARVGGLEVLKLYLARGLKIDFTDFQGNTVAHIAAEHSHLEFLKMISKEHEIFQMRNQDRRYPVQVAALQKKSFAVLKFFLEMYPEHIMAKDVFGNTIIHTLAKRNDVETFDRIYPVVSAQLDINAINDEGLGAMHIAASCGNLEFIKKIRAIGASVDLKNTVGQTPLMIAAQEGKHLCCRLLCELGADLHTSNEEGEGALHLAVRNLHKQTVIELIALEKQYIRPKSQYCMSNRSDLTYEPPIHEFPKDARDDPQKISDAMDIFKILIFDDHNLNYLNENGEHLAHIMAANSDPVFLHYLYRSKELIFLGSLDVDMMDHYWNTPLHKAAKANRHKNVEMLMSLGANINFQNKYQECALLIAAEFRYHRVWQVLLKTWMIYLRAQDRKGRNVLHILFDNKKTLKDRDLLFIKELLIRAPGLLKTKDKQGRTPLHSLCQNNHSNAIQLLLLYGNMDCRSYEQWVRHRSKANEEAADLAPSELAAKIRSFPKAKLGELYRQKRSFYDPLGVKWAAGFVQHQFNIQPFIIHPEFFM
jgi:ankyrin repeat protein